MPPISSNYDGRQVLTYGGYRGLRWDITKPFRCHRSWLSDCLFPVQLLRCSVTTVQLLMVMVIPTVNADD